MLHRHWWSSSVLVSSSPSGHGQVRSLGRQQHLCCGSSAIWVIFLSVQPLMLVSSRLCFWAYCWRVLRNSISRGSMGVGSLLAFEFI